MHLFLVNLKKLSKTTAQFSLRFQLILIFFLTENQGILLLMSLIFSQYNSVCNYPLVIYNENIYVE